MTDRKKEKVISALEHCADNSCTGCPMLATCEEVGFSVLAADLLAMIRPRVLELAEADEADICWIEGKNVERIIPCRVHCYPDTARIFKLIANKEDLALDEYGVAWRCWSARPTKAQRKAAAWNDECARESSTRP